MRKYLRGFGCLGEATGRCNMLFLHFLWNRSPDYFTLRWQFEPQLVTQGRLRWLLSSAPIFPIIQGGKRWAQNSQAVSRDRGHFSGKWRRGSTDCILPWRQHVNMFIQPRFLISAPSPSKQDWRIRCIGLLCWPLGRQKWVSCRSGCDLSGTARGSGLARRDRQPGWQLLTMSTFMPSDTGMEDSSVGWACTRLTAWCHGLCLSLRGHTVFWSNLSPEACTDSQHSHIKRMLHRWRPWVLTWAGLTGCKVTSDAGRGCQLAKHGLDKSQ